MEITDQEVSDLFAERGIAIKKWQVRSIHDNIVSIDTDNGIEEYELYHEGDIVLKKINSNNTNVLPELTQFLNINSEKTLLSEESVYNRTHKEK